MADDSGGKSRYGKAERTADGYMAATARSVLVLLGRLGEHDRDHPLIEAADIDGAVNASKTLIESMRTPFTRIKLRLSLYEALAHLALLRVDFGRCSALGPYAMRGNPNLKLAVALALAPVCHLSSDPNPNLRGRRGMCVSQGVLPGSLG